jgi:hypothetical protein
MSLAIQADDITAVLLADGWHSVSSGFDVDAYEFKLGSLLIHGGGTNDVCGSGFVFTEPDGVRTAGPLTSILAVRRGVASPKAADGTVIPEWCGECDGPELEKRWVDVPTGTTRRAAKRCPRCNPHAAKDATQG